MEEEVVERGFLSREQRNLESWRTRNSGSRRVSIPVGANVTDHLSKWLFPVMFKRINRTRVSGSEMKLIQLTLSPWRGCHQPERVG